MSTSLLSWWLLPASIVVAVASFSATSHSDPNAQRTPANAAAVFTFKSLLGIKPTKDQIRASEAALWKLAFDKCPVANHVPPVRVGDSRLTIAKEKQAPSGAFAEATTLEMDFECGTCGGRECPFAQYCVDKTTHATCEVALPPAVAFNCIPATGYTVADRHMRCTALKVDPTNLAVALPTWVKMTSVVSGKDRVADILARLHASVDPGGKLRDSTGKEIVFFALTGCWGNEPKNASDIMRKQEVELQQLRKTSTVVEISCAPSGRELIP